VATDLETMDHAQELSEGGYEMLRAAVNTARDHQCRSLQSLKERFSAAWPGRGADIDAALNYWSADIRRRHPNGVRR
jgi:hypothetical protein